MRIDILPVSGKTVPVYSHNGELFAETPASGEYTIRLTNNSADRVEAVVSVDGIDTCNGKNANPEYRGWVLSPWQTLDVPGWFRTHEEVAAFQFSKAGSGAGYAEKTGRGTDNVGVIGVAVFKEKVFPTLQRYYTQQQQQQPPPWQNWPMATQGILRSSGGAVYGSSSTKGLPPADSDTSRTYCSTAEVKTSGGIEFERSCNVDLPSDVATGYGRKVESHSVSTSFTRASDVPAEILSLRYATTKVLKSWGVPVGARPSPRPNPFPDRGVPAPMGWKG
jgi:hypothetical protein